MSGTTISVDEIVGKTLFAEKTVHVIDINGNVAYTVNAGERVGVVDTFLKVDNHIYWILADGYRVLHEPGNFDLDSIVEQGGQTSEDKTKERERQNQTWWERAMSSVTAPFAAQTKTVQYAITALIILVVVVAAVKIIQKSNIDFSKFKPQTA